MSIWSMVMTSGSPHETWFQTTGVPTLCRELPSSYQGFLKPGTNPDRVLCANFALAPERLRREIIGGSMREELR